MDQAAKEISQLGVHSTWGPIHVEVVRGLVVACRLPFRRAAPVRRFHWLGMRMVSATARDRAVLRQAALYLKAMLTGKPACRPPFRWPEATPFRLKVWRELAKVPWGQTVTYGQLARKIGRPAAARAVGQACGANPLPLLIPCHRVLAGDGGWGGFSCGAAWKQLLLQQERPREAVRMGDGIQRSSYEVSW